MTWATGFACYVGHMNVAVLGTGYVASAYLRALHFLGHHPLVLSRAWLDYIDQDVLHFCLEAYKPDMVINAAGYTGRTVDDCQVNKEECYQANVVLPRQLASICAGLGVTLMHVSSGCIFDGHGPFKEDDKPNFLQNFYQQCKFSAEQDIVSSKVRSFIFRIRMPFGHYHHERNWLDKLCGHRHVLAGLNSVTMVGSFAMRSFQLASGGMGPPGVYHCAESKPVRTEEVAGMLYVAGLRKHRCDLIAPDLFLKAGHVPRSAAVLDVSKFEKAYGAQFGDALVALRWCIDRLAAHNA